MGVVEGFGGLDAELGDEVEEIAGAFAAEGGESGERLADGVRGRRTKYKGRRTKRVRRCGGVFWQGRNATEGVPYRRRRNGTEGVRYRTGVTSASPHPALSRPAVGRCPERGCSVSRSEMATFVVRSPTGVGSYTKGVDNGGEGLAFDVAHGVEVDAAFAADSVDFDDVWMIEVRGCQRFVFEALQLAGVEDGGEGEDLKRDSTVE
jgi:hypothetical protein